MLWVRGAESFLKLLTLNLQSKGKNRVNYHNLNFETIMKVQSLQKICCDRIVNGQDVEEDGLKIAEADAIQKSNAEYEKKITDSDQWQKVEDAKLVLQQCRKKLNKLKQTIRKDKKKAERKICNDFAQCKINLKRKRKEVARLCSHLKICGSETCGKLFDPQRKPAYRGCIRECERNKLCWKCFEEKEERDPCHCVTLEHLMSLCSRY